MCALMRIHILSMGIKALPKQRLDIQEVNKGLGEPTP